MFSGEFWAHTRPSKPRPEYNYDFLSITIGFIFQSSIDLLIAHFFFRTIYIRVFQQHWSLILKMVIVILAIHVGTQISYSSNRFYIGALYPKEKIYESEFVELMLLAMKYIHFYVWTLFYFGLLVLYRRQKDRQQRMELEAAVHEAQLSGLKQQLNPHFVFNTLNSLRVMITKDKQIAKGMVSGMENLLKYTLSQSHRNTVTLAEEIEIVKDYLAIEKLRFGDRIKVNWDVPQELPSFLVIPLCLQTLVENAVKYGINQYEDGIYLNITASRTDNQLQVSVENRGQLIENSNPGIGLHNTRQRLELIFGETASLTLRQTDRDSVLAEIHIPLNTKRTDTQMRSNISGGN